DGVGVEERQLPNYDLAEEGLLVPESTVGGLHFNGLGHHDRSTYEMRVVEFSYNELSDDYSFKLNTPSTPVIASKTSKVVDINGDGIIDIVTLFGCSEAIPGRATTTNSATGTRCFNSTDSDAMVGVVDVHPTLLAGYPNLPSLTDDFHCNYGPGTGGINCGPNHVNSKRGYYITSLQQAKDEVLDLLKSVEDGFGNTSRWHYAPLSSSVDRPETDIPLYSVPNRDLGIDYLQNGELDHFYFTSSMYVVSAFDQFNGLWETSGSPPEPLFNTTYYGYEEAVFNNQGRGFQGFRKVLSEQVITNPSDQDDDSQNNLRSVSIFHQIFPLAGQIEATYTQAASIIYDPMQDRETSGVNAGQFKKPANVLSFTETEFACLDTNAAPQNDCGLGSGSGNSVQAGSGFYQPVMLSSTSRQYEPNASYANYAETTATMVYDRYGNVTEQTTQLNNVSAEGVFTHTQTVDNSYTNDASPGSWWLGRLDHSVTTGDVTYDNGFTVPSALPNGTSATTDDKIVTQLLQYNAQRRPNCMYVVEGEQSNTALACNDNEAITAFGNLQVSRTLTDYDNYGNPRQITVDANDLEAPRVTSSSYTSDGYFPAAVNNALGHTVTTIIEPREGQPTQVMDANDLITRMEYDHFGREIRRWYPYSSATPYASVGAHYAPRSQVAYQSGAACGVNLPPSMTYCVWTVADGAPMVWEAYDSLNRVIETRTQGFKGSSGSQNWIYNSVVYNGRGQTIAESVPEYTLNATHPLTYRYDVLGRQVFKQ
ncbi:MAG: hypothetical protein MI750_14270, partial [Xanthomonadales bacterium]|nr:hypothetical protein [Xanthomonadales bacterium]